MEQLVKPDFQGINSNKQVTRSKKKYREKAFYGQH